MPARSTTTTKATKPTAAKASKAAATKKPTSKATKVVAHPSWKDIISECIVLHKEDARIGVSRQMIKKYASDKYKLEATPANTSRLAQAITHGAEKGTFVLPKGPAGRVKLSPAGKAAKSDENVTPPPKAAKSAPAKAVKPTSKTAPKKTTAKAPASKTVANKKPVAKKTAPKTAAAKAAIAKVKATRKTAPKSSTSAPRKAPIARKAPTVRA